MKKVFKRRPQLTQTTIKNEKVIEKLTEQFFSEIDLSEIPVVWNLYRP